MATKHHLDNPIRLAWERQWRELARYVAHRRGLPSHLAASIGVSRQTVHRWLQLRPPPPAWASNALHKLVRLARDKPGAQHIL